MKKVKLMLLSLSILAVVGGALAFTAKVGTKVCTIPVDQSSICSQLTCPTLNSVKVTTTDDFICSTPSVNGGCLDPNDPTGQTPLNCAGTVKRSIVE